MLPGVRAVLAQPVFVKALRFYSLVARDPPRLPEREARDELCQHLNGLSEPDQAFMGDLLYLVVGINTLCRKGLSAPLKAASVVRSNLDWGKHTGTTDLDSVLPRIAQCARSLSTSIPYDINKHRRHFEAAYHFFQRHPYGEQTVRDGWIWFGEARMKRIFRDVDGLARLAGGKKIFTWLRGRMSHHPRDVPFNLLFNFALKYIRGSGESRHLGHLANLSQRITDLLGLNPREFYAGFYRPPSVLMQDLRYAQQRRLLAIMPKRDVEAEIGIVEQIFAEENLVHPDWEIVKRLFRAGEHPSSIELRPVSAGALARHLNVPHDERLKTILEEWSHQYPEPNSRFRHAYNDLSELTSNRRPLIRVNSDEFLVTPGLIGRLSLVDEMVSRLNCHRRGQGFERYVKGLLATCPGADVVTGLVRRDDGSDLSDVDALILAEHPLPTVFLFECKCVDDHVGTRRGFDYTSLSYAQRGFLKSQSQMLALQSKMVADGFLVVRSKDQQVRIENRERIVRVSVTFRDWGDMHDSPWPLYMLRNFSYARITMTPHDKAADEINKVISAIQESKRSLMQSGHGEVEIFHPTLFVNVTQLRQIVGRVRSVNELSSVFYRLATSNFSLESILDIVAPNKAE